MPLPLALAPERILVNLACILIGLSAVVREPSSLLLLWPEGFPQAWGLTIAAGGLLALVGFWNNYRHPWANSLARLGYLLILITATIYGVGVIWVFGAQGVWGGVIYLAIAAAKLIRLVVGSAYRNRMIRGGPNEGEKRDPREDNGGAR